jgi:hypothetical protein
VTGRGLSAASVVAAAAMLIVACGGNDAAPSSAGPSAVPTASPPSGATPSGAPPSASTAPSGSNALGRYQPVWPFTGADEAADWQRRYRSGGHQPWRLSADATALAFVRYLGFDEIDRVTRRTVAGGDARIGVGRSTGEGRGRAAAVVHLIRLGSGSDAPWEVVGTDDTDLTLTAPAYGAAVSSPVTVGGRITGVDESIRLEARQRSSGDPIGRSCCVPAGGQGSPWSARLTFHGATDPVVTIVVSTGGHVADVERFAVTAVRVSQ